MMRDKTKLFVLGKWYLVDKQFEGCYASKENDTYLSLIVGSFALFLLCCHSTPFVVYCALMIVDAHNVGCQAGCVFVHKTVGWNVIKLLYRSITWVDWWLCPWVVNNKYTAQLICFVWSCWIIIAWLLKCCWWQIRWQWCGIWFWRFFV